VSRVTLTSNEALALLGMAGGGIVAAGLHKSAMTDIQRERMFKTMQGAKAFMADNRDHATDNIATEALLSGMDKLLLITHRMKGHKE
jgi:hypothetical protein